MRHDTIKLLSALQFGNNNGMLTFKDNKQQNGRKYQRFKKFHMLARVLIHVDLLFVQWVELPSKLCCVGILVKLLAFSTNYFEGGCSGGSVHSSVLLNRTNVPGHCKPC